MENLISFVTQNVTTPIWLLLSMVILIVTLVLVAEYFNDRLTLARQKIIHLEQSCHELYSKRQVRDRKGKFATKNKYQ